MRWAVALAVVAGTATGCAGSDAPGERVVTVTVTAPASPPPSETPAVTATPTPTPTPPPSTATGTSWTMPNLVGSNLQDAQNAVQDLTDFEIAITTSHDSTGAGRQQVLDRNWKVCSQSVKPGATIRKGTQIDFGAVKLDEKCR